MSQPIPMVYWEPFVPTYPLGTGDLHLWKIDCGPGGSSLDTQWVVLSDRERERAGRLRLARHRERYVRAHAGLRRILSFYVKDQPHLIVFKYGSSGKPSLMGSENLVELNMTTSDDLALVAISRYRPVGIDCEKIRPRAELISMARRMFSTQEAEVIATAGDEDRADLFYRAWTAMEASVKADGRGLFRRRLQPETGTLEIAHFVPSEGFVAAVACAALPPPRAWQAFSLTES